MEQNATPNAEAAHVTPASQFTKWPALEAADKAAVSVSVNKLDVTGEGKELKQLHVEPTGAAATPDNTATVAETAAAAAVNRHAVSARALLDSTCRSSSTGVDHIFTAEAAAKEVDIIQPRGCNKDMLEGTVVHSSGVRSDSFSSTCDDTPHSQTSNGSFSCGLSDMASLSSLSNHLLDVRSPPLIDGAQRADDGNNKGSNSISGTDGKKHGGSSSSTLEGFASSSSSFEESYVQENTIISSSSACNRATSSSKGRSTNGSSEQTVRNYKHSSSSSSTSGANSISLDHTLESYESKPVSDTSGGCYEKHLRKKEGTGVVKGPLPQLLNEQREAGRLQLQEEPADSDFGSETERPEKSNDVDICTVYLQTALNVPGSSKPESSTRLDSLRSSIIKPCSNGSPRRRSSSCSVSSKGAQKESDVVRGRLRLSHSESGDEEEHRRHEGIRGEKETWLLDCYGSSRGGATERTAASDGNFCKRPNAEIGSGSPRLFVAAPELKTDSVFTTAADESDFKETEYASKKSRRSFEHGGWSYKQPLSSSPDCSPRESTPTAIDPFFRNCYSSPPFHGAGSIEAGGSSADAGVQAGSPSEKHTSPRQASAISRGNRNRGTPFLSVSGSMEQQQQGNRSRDALGRSPLDGTVPDSPRRPAVKVASFCKEESKSAEGAETRKAGGGGGAAESSASSAKDNAACKREDRWTSPFPGVKYCRSRNAWIARWSESGQEKWKTFPVKDSSFEEARRRALEFRQEKDRRKFERLWQQLNAEGAATGSNGEMRNLMSPGGGKASGSDSSSGEGSVVRRRAAEGRTGEEREMQLRSDTKVGPTWQQQQQHEEEVCELISTPRLTRLSAYRASRLLHSTQRQRRKKQELQQQQQLQEPIEWQADSCGASREESVSKSEDTTKRCTGCNAGDFLGGGRVWLSPGSYSSTWCLADNEKDGVSVFPKYCNNGLQQRTSFSNSRMLPQGAQTTGPSSSDLSPGSGCLSAEETLRRELAADGVVKGAAAVVTCSGTASSVVGQNAVLASAKDGLTLRQQHSPANGMVGRGHVADAEGTEGLAGGRVVEALLRVLTGESADVVRKEGLCQEKIMHILGERVRGPVNALARLAAEEAPVSRKRRSRDEADTTYHGSEATTAGAVTPTSVKILSMYKAALLLIMDDLTYNGLPLFVASGGGAPLGTDFRQLPHAPAFANGDLHLWDRKALVEQSMKKMMEEQRRRIAEASLLGDVSPFVKLFETCILDQKLPSQADASGKTQLLYLNALSALQELALSVKSSNSSS